MPGVTAEKETPIQPTSYGEGLFDALEGVKQMIQERRAPLDFREYYLQGVETRLIAGFSERRVRQLVLDRVIRIEDLMGVERNLDAATIHVRRHIGQMEATTRRIAARITTSLSS